MQFNLDKSSGSQLNLSKGDVLNFSKENGEKLTQFCVGANWGAIESSGFFGMGGGKEAVDLDLGAGMFDADGRLVNKIFFQNRRSFDLNQDGIWLSEDDQEGDLDGDDGLDNEVLMVNTDKIPSNVKTIAFILISFRGQVFDKIPFASVRLYEGDADRVTKSHAQMNVAQSSEFNGKVSLVLGKLTRTANGSWDFATIGQPVSDKNFDNTLSTVGRDFL